MQRMFFFDSNFSRYLILFIINIVDFCSCYQVEITQIPQLFAWQQVRTLRTHS